MAHQYHTLFGPFPREYIDALKHTPGITALEEGVGVDSSPLLSVHVSSLKFEYTNVNFQFVETKLKLMLC